MKRIAVVAGAFVVYAIAYSPLHHAIGPPAGAFSFLPVVIAGALLGRWLGALSSLISLTINFIVFRRFHDISPLGMFGANVPNALVGYIVGYLRDLHLELFRERGRLHEALAREQAANLQIASAAAERAQVNSRLVVADRLASLGTMAAGICHEINNPLSYTLSNLHFVARSLLEVGPHLDELDRLTTLPASRDALARLRAAMDDLEEARQDATEGAERVRNIVRDMKSFAPADERIAVVDLAKVIDSAINMSWNEIRHRAVLKKEYRPTPAVRGNESRLAQVILNLLVNAAQATPEGHVEDHEITVTTSTDAAGNAVILIADMGEGIPPDVLGRIFDPFFTTKAPGAGTGLGLSICHTIIASLGGHIDVTSELGRGTCFRIVLPATTVVAKAVVEDPPEVVKRPSTLLVIDDEEQIGSVIVKLLSPDYTVVSVTSGKEALRRIGEGERYDLTICDLLMPEITGMEFHEELMKVDPALAARTIFMTGGAFTPNARAFLDRVPDRWFEKPFDVRALRALVSKRLLATT